MNSCHNLTKSKFSEMLHRQCKVNGKLKTPENLQTPFTLHWRCSIAVNFTLCEIVEWFRRQFVSKLEFRVLVELFSISRLQLAHVSTVCARCFSAFCACPELCYVWYCVTWLYNVFPILFHHYRTWIWSSVGFKSPTFPSLISSSISTQP